jgi:hypothetical protein
MAENECEICLDILNEREQFPCGHEICSKCFITFLEAKSEAQRCPFCLKEFILAILCTFHEQELYLLLPRSSSLWDFHQTLKQRGKWGKYKLLVWSGIVGRADKDTSLETKFAGDHTVKIAWLPNV